MADYNVQMKQYNGTSFDNILPHAYLADTATELAGVGGATEIIAQARAGLSQIVTGSYVGNGQTNLSINVGFKPKFVMVRSKVTGWNKVQSRSGDAYINVLGSYEDGGIALERVNVPEAMFWVEGITKFTVISVYTNQFYYYVYQNWNATNTGFNVSVSVSNEFYISDYKEPKYMCNVSGTEYTYIAFS
nr:MAG TPA: hypothetical protein [Bacteriophage sp.]